MTTTLSRRVERLERALSPEQSGPCFVMAPDRTTADREIARIKAEFGDRLPRCLFVMTLAGCEKSGQ